MATDDRWATSKTKETPVYDKMTTTTEGPSSSTATTTENASSSSNSTANASSHTTNMDPASLAALQALIGLLSKGGTPEIKAEIENRRRVQALVTSLLDTVTTQAATNDAAGLMAANLRSSSEKNIPMLMRSIENAGTSGSSLSSLLANDLATRSAESAAALGGEQAKAYAAQRSALASVLEALTRPTATAENLLVNALGVAKGAVVDSNSSEVKNTSSSSTGTRVTETKNSGGTKTMFEDILTNSNGNGNSSGGTEVDGHFGLPAGSIYTPFTGASLYDFIKGM